MPEITNVVEILINDHNLVKRLFKQFEQQNEKKVKLQLLVEIVREVGIHSKVEEEIVYPVVEMASMEKAAESYEEHHVVEEVMAELGNMSVLNVRAMAKIKVLQELVLHHIEEEETTVLPILEQTGANLNALGQRVLQRKQELKQLVSRKAA
ncbi:MAG TPA: hemerythrin domain-containing protein [Candidatus Obscuribacterales bacterium]